jgi:hypothetical protein
VAATTGNLAMTVTADQGYAYGRSTVGWSAVASARGRLSSALATARIRCAPVRSPRASATPPGDTGPCESPLASSSPPSPRSDQHEITSPPHFGSDLLLIELGPFHGPDPSVNCPEPSHEFSCFRLSRIPEACNASCHGAGQDRLRTRRAGAAPLPSSRTAIFRNRIADVPASGHPEATRQGCNAGNQRYNATMLPTVAMPNALDMADDGHR